MKLALLAAVTLGAGAAPAQAAPDSATLKLSAQLEARGTAPSNRHGVGDQTRAVETAELRAQMSAPWRNAVHGVFAARHASGEDGGLRINELSLERPFGAGFLSAGKKVMSWDVGYAFRPLDVVQQEDRRALYTTSLVGVPMLAWESFDADRAITVVLSNPGSGRKDQPRDDGALAVRLYRQNGARDEYAVLRLSERNGVEGGASFSHVVNEGLELHGSLLWQQRHDEWIAQRWRRRDGGGKALAGINWTSESKFSVLLEAWIDRGAAVQQERSMLLRVAQNESGLDLSADLLWMPQDGGRIVSVGIAWKPEPWLFSLSWRHYGGSAGAVVRSMGIMTAQHSF